MSNELNNKFKQLESLLENDSFLDGFKSLLTSTSKEPDESFNKEVSNIQHSNQLANKTSDMGDTLFMFKNVLDTLNTKSSKTMNLLEAILPFLSEHKQKKLNDFKKIIQITNLNKLIQTNKPKIIVQETKNELI